MAPADPLADAGLHDSGQPRGPARFFVALKRLATILCNPSCSTPGGSMRNFTQHITTFIAIGIAASCGAILRYAVASACGRIFLVKFPVGTFLINMSASLFLGWFLAF